MFVSYHRRYSKLEVTIFSIPMYKNSILVYKPLKHKFVFQHAKLNNQIISVMCDYFLNRNHLLINKRNLKNQLKGCFILSVCIIVGLNRVKLRQKKSFKPFLSVSISAFSLSSIPLQKKVKDDFSHTSLCRWC